MKSFNLIEEPWIPCLMLDGTLVEFSLMVTLEKAHKIKELGDSSPLVNTSLYRPLLAILHRVFGPKNFDEWKDHWRKENWDKEKLTNYFDEWKHRFDLFDEERPFYQYPVVKKKDGKNSDDLPVETLMQEKASGANATLFDHSYKSRKSDCPPSMAARYLITRHAFSLAGGVSYPFNLSNGPLVKGFSVLAIGDNLFQTLALNLMVYHRDKPMPVQDDDGISLDKPIWERDILQEATERDREGSVPLGYLDYLTWQSRRIKLMQEDNYQSVRSCQLQQNYKLKEDLNIFDPFKVYVEGERGRYALDFKTHKSLWRDSTAIFRQTEASDEIINLFKHLAKISAAIANREIDGRRRYAFSIVGIINDQASVETWMHERFSIPLAYFDDNDLTRLLEAALEFAQNLSEKLRAGIKKLAEILETDITNFQALPVYWSSLEVEFHKLLVNLPLSHENAMQEWFGVVLATANRAFRQTADSLSGSAAERRAVVEAEDEFREKRNILLSKHKTDWGKYLPETKAKGGTQ